MYVPVNQNPMHRQKKDLEFCIGKQNWKYVNILVAYVVQAIAPFIRGFIRTAYQEAPYFRYWKRKAREFVCKDGVKEGINKLRSKKGHSNSKKITIANDKKKSHLPLLYSLRIRRPDILGPGSGSLKSLLQGRRLPYLKSYR